MTEATRFGASRGEINMDELGETETEVTLPGGDGDDDGFGTASDERTETEVPPRRPLGSTEPRPTFRIDPRPEPPRDEEPSASTRTVKKGMGRWGVLATVIISALVGAGSLGTYGYYGEIKPLDKRITALEGENETLEQAVARHQGEGVRELYTGLVNKGMFDAQQDAYPWSFTAPIDKLGLDEDLKDEWKKLVHAEANRVIQGREVNELKSITFLSTEKRFVEARVTFSGVDRGKPFEKATATIRLHDTIPESDVKAYRMMRTFNIEPTYLKDEPVGSKSPAKPIDNLDFDTLSSGS